MFFFFNDTATTEIYTLSLHDALPIYHDRPEPDAARLQDRIPRRLAFRTLRLEREVDHHDPVLLHEPRSEEHTSELQSQSNLVCRLLLEKKTAAPRRWPSRTSGRVPKT